MMAGRFALVSVAFIGLSACVGYDIENLRATETQGKSFTEALTREYRDFTLFEADQMYDWIDAGHFARKGLEAANGVVVEPEAAEAWDLPSPEDAEIRDYREKLVALLNASARNKAPMIAAYAQARFDCWVEQQEENHQPTHIAACRDGFIAALKQLEAIMAPPAPEPAPAPPAAVVPTSYIVYFDFDSDQLSAEAMSLIERALAAPGDAASRRYSLTGHADRSGSDSYNLDLSVRRAVTVRDYLIDHGIDPNNTSVAGRGESEPAMATADGVAEPKNRRVEMLVE